MMKMMGRVPYLNNPMMQMQLEMSAFRQFKEEALKALKQQEAAVLNEREKEIPSKHTAESGEGTV